MLLAGCGKDANEKSDKSKKEDNVVKEDTIKEDSEKENTEQGDTDKGNAEQGDTAKGNTTKEDVGAIKGKQHTWQEITITIPEEWEGRYVVEEEEDSLSFYHKASYNKETGSGFLCGVQRMGEYINYGLGEKLVAYTDDGRLYYFRVPTDVACDSEDENILKEYGEMSRLAEDTRYSVQINVPGVHTDPDEYILPLSSILKLERDALLNMTGDALWIARNEIYARHGRQFNNENLQKRFNSCSWYKGTIPAEQFDEGSLSQLEKDNLKILIEAEQEYKRMHPDYVEGQELAAALASDEN